MKNLRFIPILIFTLIAQICAGQKIVDPRRDSLKLSRYLNGPSFHKSTGSELFTLYHYNRKLDSLLQTPFPKFTMYGMKYNPTMTEALPPYFGKKGLPFYMQGNRYDYLYKAKKRSLQER